MDFLKAEIERKRKMMEEAKVLKTSSGPTANKYFKRGELLKKQDADYRRRDAEERRRTEEKDEKKKQRLREEEEAIYSQLGGKNPKKDREDDKNGGKESSKESSKDDSGPSKSTTAADQIQPEADLLPRSTVERVLREFGLPVRFFGESDDEACERLREEERLRGGGGGGNQQGQDTTEKQSNALAVVDAAYEKIRAEDEVDDKEEEKQEEEMRRKKRSSVDVELYDSDHTYDDLLKMEDDAGKGDANIDLKLIAEFMRVMLKMWGQKLNARDEEVKTTVTGKAEANRYTQTRTYLKPLLRMLRKQTVTDTIRDSLLKMIRSALQRDYIECSRAYMEMAIGNAPWPIGVTNPGIHARPSREGIFAKQIAHVLNDETQRKYIQGLKRLITKAQEYYPTDPSRSIDYIKRSDPEMEAMAASEANAPGAPTREILFQASTKDEDDDDDSD